MKTALATLESISPYSQSKQHDMPKKEQELPRDYDIRTWRERAHFDDEGNCFIPPMAFKTCLSEAAKFLGKKIPGQRNATWTKHYEAGVMVLETVKLGVKKDDMGFEDLSLSPTGKRGQMGVMKRMPLFQRWSAKVPFNIIDDCITESSFRETLDVAGQLIGIGRFRPRNGGYYGRFKVLKIEWID